MWDHTESPVLVLNCIVIVNHTLTEEVANTIIVILLNVIDKQLNYGVTEFMLEQASLLEGNSVLRRVLPLK